MPFIGLKIKYMYWKTANFSICDPVTIVTVNIAPTYLLFYVYLDSLDHLLHVYQVWSYYTNTKNCKNYEYTFL